MLQKDRNNRELCQEVKNVTIVLITHLISRLFTNNCTFISSHYVFHLSKWLCDDVTHSPMGDDNDRTMEMRPE